jgi:DNA helicase-2/ATP-dependent DNA helicase PcrA
LVLAQRRVIGNKIHDALVARDVPSKSYYKEGELDSITAQERIAIFKLLLDRQDRIALRWLLGYGSTDFRKGAYARIRQQCEGTGLSPWDLMERLNAREIAIPYTGGLIQRFREIKQQIIELEGIESPTDLVDRWLGPETDDTKSLRDLVINLLPDVTTPKGLFTKLIETISTPEIPPDVTEARIMSLHKSKGLSSPVVVIAGCVEGLLPAAPDPDMAPAEKAASLEEQRRLFYVGITRVKADVARQQPGHLLLTNSRTMTLADAMASGVKAASISYGTANLLASRFINELGRTAPRPISG